MNPKIAVTTANLQNQITGAVSSLGKLVRSPFRHILPHKPKSPPRVAASPGIEYAAGVDEKPIDGDIAIQCIDYGDGKVEETSLPHVEALIAHPSPEWSKHRWINVEGLHPYVINELRKAFDFHTLAAEDALHTPQRPKLETYDNHNLVIMDMLRIEHDSLLKEQVSMIVIGNTLITFQEHKGDVWNPVRKRIKRPESRFHNHSVWYLAYALIDAVVDNIYPILEHYGEVLTELEERAMSDPTPDVQQNIYYIKRELYGMRRSIWPMRELTQKLTYEETSPLDSETRVFMRDVQDHTVQIMELIESSREMANSLQDFYISTVSNRMNEVMKALTIMASLFLPITFLAGVYGMNFDFIPELSWHYAYPVFWGTCFLCTGGLLWYFKRKGWIGR